MSFRLSSLWLTGFVRCGAALRFRQNAIMEVILTTFLATDSYDLKKSVSENRLLGMWRMMTGFRQVYLSAALTLGLAAIAKTATFLLLRYLVDNVLGSSNIDVRILPVM